MVNCRHTKSRFSFCRELRWRLIVCSYVLASTCLAGKPSCWVDANRSSRARAIDITIIENCGILDPHTSNATIHIYHGEIGTIDKTAIGMKIVVSNCVFISFAVVNGGLVEESVQVADGISVSTISSKTCVSINNTPVDDEKFINFAHDVDLHRNFGEPPFASGKLRVLTTSPSSSTFAIIIDKDETLESLSKAWGADIKKLKELNGGSNCPSSFRHGTKVVLPISE